MRICFPTLLSVGAILALAVAATAPAEEIAFLPKYQPGDSYVLTLGATSETDASSGGSVSKRFHEMLQMDYEATVVILEVDGEGRPIRERHQDVSMVVRSTQGSGPVFEGDLTLEVHRHHGKVRVFCDGCRTNPNKEKAIVRILETQFEHTLEPSLLDPRRPVAVGESWELDRSLAGELLRRRGVRVAAFGEPATATLVRRAGDDGSVGLEVDYRIPISWVNVSELFPSAFAGETDGLLQGRVRFAPALDRVPISRTSTLTLDVDGAVTTSAEIATRPYPWSVHSSRVAEQSAAKVGTPYAGEPGPVGSDRSAR
jgi:hypothetical protein